MLAKAIARPLGLMGLLFGLLAASAPSAQPQPMLEPGSGSLPAAHAVAAAKSACPDIADLPRRLDTLSKYDQSIATKSVIDTEARERRENQLAPISAAIRTVSTLARSGETEQQRNAAVTCTVRALRHWAATAALTDMATSDANLSRDRFTSDIAGILLILQARGHDLRGEPDIAAWLATLARQTISYYDWKAGPTARRNNHRYLAGIAVAEIGGIVGDDQMLAWSRTSFTLGACQIDDRGALPLELARAERAYEYHLYAYRALAELANRIQVANAPTLPCLDRLDRLHRLIAGGPESAAEFQRMTGLRQLPPSRQHLAAADLAPPRAKDMQTVSDVKNRYNVPEPKISSSKLN